GAGADHLVAEAQNPAGAVDGHLVGVLRAPVPPLDGDDAVEGLRLGRFPGPVDELDRPRLDGPGPGTGQGGGRTGGNERAHRRAGDHAAEDDPVGRDHGPKRTGTAIGANWVSGSPVIDARAACVSASEGSEGATSGSRGRSRAMAAATAAARAQTARRRRDGAGRTAPLGPASAPNGSSPTSGRRAAWTGMIRIARRAAATSSSSARQSAQVARWASASCRAAGASSSSRKAD